MLPTDPDFAQALALLDAGEATPLRALLAAKPRLLRGVVDLTPAPPAYFKDPKLLWFVAENPIRNNYLPSTIIQSTTALIAEARDQGVAEFGKDLTTTLALVATGCVARQCGVQQALIALLAGAGGDPAPALNPAAAHGELVACEALLEAGARLSAPVAAALGREDAFAQLLAKIDAAARETVVQQALSLAAINGQAGCARLALEAGADPNLLNPQCFHAHSTPLHQAISHGSLETVRALIEVGADPTIKDTLFGGDAMGWARNLGRAQIAAYLGGVGGADGS